MDIKTQDYINKAKIIHGDKYDYSEVTYKTSKDKITIICKEHGKFQIVAGNHLYNGFGCKQCGYDSQKGKERKVITYQEFIKKAREIHGNKYTYYKLNSDFKLTNPITIGCKVHGKFELSSASNHINNKRGCFQCATDSSRKIKNKQELAELLNINENNILTEPPYSIDGKVKINYNNTIAEKTIRNFIKPKISKKYKVIRKEIIKKESLSTIKLDNDFNNISLEEKIEKIISSFYQGQVIRHYKLEGKELDFYFPDNNIGIECHGLYWHSEKKLDVSTARNHIRDKYLLCKRNNIQLLQFYEDEINSLPLDLLTNMIGYKLGYAQEYVYARKCVVKSISKEDAKEFLNNNHIQGSCSFKLAYGLFYVDKLVSAMAFNYFISNRGTKFDGVTWELVRFSTLYNVIGGASKLLKRFINEYNPKTIYSYSDNRFSYGNLYEKLNFTFDNESKQDYFYTKNNKRYHKSKFKRSAQLSRSKTEDYSFDSNLSEIENAHQNNFYRIWDAGKIRWKLQL